MRYALILILLFSISLVAKVYDRNGGRDLKLPTQHLLERVTITAPAAASTSYVGRGSWDGPSSAAAATISTSLVNRST